MIKIVAIIFLNLNAENTEKKHGFCELKYIFH